MAPRVAFPEAAAAARAAAQPVGSNSFVAAKSRHQQFLQLPLQRRSKRPLQLAAGVVAVLFACGWHSSLVPSGSRLQDVAWAPAGLAATLPGFGGRAQVSSEEEEEENPADQGVSVSALGTAALIAVGVVSYGGAWRSATALQAKEAAEGEPVASGQAKKKPRIDAFDSIRFFLIAYIASGHFIHTATMNAFLLKLVTQINVVVGAFFVLSGYVAAYTTTELGERKGSKRLDNAVEFAVSRIMGLWPLHLVVLLLFSPMFVWVDASFSGPFIAAWHAFLSVTMLQSWFPLSAEIWNAPTWFLSAYAFCLCVLPYALRVLAVQKKAELRRTLVFLTLCSLIFKVGYSYDLKAWDIMEGTLNAKTHPNYMLFNTIRFSPFGAVLEVLMGAAACRLVMLDKEGDAGSTGSPLGPLVFMFGLLTLRAAGVIALNDLLVRTVFFIPHWIVFLMRIHRQSVGPGGAQKILPKILCKPLFTFLGGVSFPIFIVHGPIGQVFYKKAVATQLFGGTFSNPQPGGIDWFFGVYWAVVIVAAVVLQKAFVDNARVKSASAALSTSIVKKLTS